MVLDVLTTALESAAVLLLVVAVGWAVFLLAGSPFGVPAALASSGAAAWAASWALQWASDRPGSER